VGEKEIKSVILNFLLANERVVEDALFFSEMNLAKKVRRLDLGFVKEGKMVAIEIKSEKDSLIRLQGQVAEYCKYFDRVIVAVAPRFVEAAVALVGSDVGVWRVSNEGVKVIRKGRVIKGVCKDSYVELMTRREVSILAKKIGVKSEGVAMYELKLEVKKHIARLSKSEIKSVLIEGFNKRFGMASDRFLKKVRSTGNVSEPDIALLSPHLARVVGKN
jgi:hypothetical protein